MINMIKSSLQGLLASFVRTIVPIVVTLVVSLLIRAGLPVDEELNGSIVAFVSSILGLLSGALYYLAVRVLEKTQPWASKLLGSSSAPVGYAPNKDIKARSVLVVPIDDVKATSTTKKSVLGAEGTKG